MIKNIIFDLDGTLANTAKDIINSLKYSLEKNNIKKNIDLNFFKKIANQGSISMIRKIIGNKRILIKKINQLFLDHYSKNICINSFLKKDALLLLRYCKKNKINLFVSTNKSEKNAKKLLKKLKIHTYFKFIAGNDTFNYKKPNPKHLSLLQKKIPFKKKETFMIGDSDVDSKLASQFNIKFILMRNGYTALESSEILSDFKVNSFKQVLKIIKKY